MTDLKIEIQAVQDDIIKTIQMASRISMTDAVSREQINKMMDEFTDALETVCIRARRTVEHYRPLLLTNDGSGIKRQKSISEVAGELEITGEGWLHIKLNTLLPHCKYKSNSYIPDTINRLLNDYEFELPKFEYAFLAIVEHCDHTNRNVYDQDNKSWKTIPNALKGRIFEDDDQFHMSLGLFSKLSEESACHIYVTSQEDAPDFVYSLEQDIL